MNNRRLQVFTMSLAVIALTVFLLSCQDPCPFKGLRKPGSKVMAQWKPNKWYPATVIFANGRKWKIRYSDGVEETKQCTEIAPDEPPEPAAVKVGDTIIARWQKGNWYTATIEEITGDKIKVVYYDGFHESLMLADLRLYPK